jgi:hypothetical protein
VRTHQEGSRLAFCCPARRWALGIVLTVLFLFTVRLYPQASNRELTRRDGVLAKAFLKARDKLTTAAVDFDGSPDPY